MSNTERKEKEIEFKKKMILDSAKQVFEESGFHKATIEQVAKNSGFAKGSVYNYFSSKKEIMEQIIIEMLIIKNEDLLEVVKSDIPPEVKIRKIIELHYQIAVTPDKNEILKYFNSTIEFFQFMLESATAMMEAEEESIELISIAIKDLDNKIGCSIGNEMNHKTIARLFTCYGRGVMTHIWSNILLSNDENRSELELESKELLEEHINFLLYNLQIANGENQEG